MSENFDVIIIGAGASGYSAAVYAARFNLKTIVIGKEKGGLLTLTHLVENWPGVVRASGLEIMQKLEEHVNDYKVPILVAEVKDIKKTKTGFEVKADSKTYKTKTIIYATGTKRKKLGIPGEERLFGKGVSYCATCDALFFKDRVVAVVGGSDSAAKEALLLSEYAKHVYIIYRREKIRAEPINIDRVNKNKKITIISNTNVKEIKGEQKVEKISLDKPYKGSKDFKIEGIFIEIGHLPQTELAKKLGARLNVGGEIVIDSMSRTNIHGFFAAGDVADSPFKQAITGAAQGVKAAFAANECITEKGCGYYKD
ncbi:FAD-dependent oxidoreductase [Candidatus Woesearchaeota archaeon]|nr:FAD-dependent oxidoreductase [Candidatus Woesearchaeota archaeon]